MCKKNLNFFRFTFDSAKSIERETNKQKKKKRRRKTPNVIHVSHVAPEQNEQQSNKIKRNGRAKKEEKYRHKTIYQNRPDILWSLAPGANFVDCLLFNTKAEC